MHIYLVTRGIKHDVDRFINELSAKYLPFKWKHKDDKGNVIENNYWCQTAVRPIQIHEVVFPEEYLQEMLVTCGGADMGKTQHKRHNKYIAALRKMLGIKKIPKDIKYDPTKKLPVYSDNVEKVILGVKEDRKNELGNEML